jgi:DNA-binding response OmpR family regulator
MVNHDPVLRVLVVDDEQLIADTLAMILSRAGFKSRAAYSGEDAVAMAPGFAPDVLISDVIMRGINGVETANRITRILPSCRILLFSGQATWSDLAELPEAGGHNFDLILKPVHPTELIDILNSRADIPGWDGTLR